MSQALRQLPSLCIACDSHGSDMANKALIDKYYLGIRSSDMLGIDGLFSNAQALSD